jgi:FixJ family two-component response regulator
MMKRVPVVFIVDDEKRMCQSLQAVLGNAGYQVAYATSGEAALEQMAQPDIDLFLLDIHMPGLNGFDLLDRILSQRRGTPAIMMTGDATVESAIHALRQGAYDFLKKPFEPEELLNTIENALRQKLLLHRTRILDNRLRLSERRFRFMFQNTPDMIYTLDTAGRFKHVNDSVARTFGYRSADLIGQYYESILWDEDIPSARWHFNERRTGERATSGLILRLKPGPHQTAGAKNGNFTVTELYATGVYRGDKANGKASRIGTYGVIRNMTHHQIQHEDPSNVQICEKSISKVLSRLGHDLSDRLSSTRGIISALKHEMQPANPYLDQIKAIETFTKNSQHRARQLLWLANGGNIDSQRMRVNPGSRKVNFWLKAPKAGQVSVAGDFNGWDARANPMSKDSAGLWKTTLMLPAGRYEFKFMVDGRWRESLESELTAPNRYGKLNNVVFVGEANPTAEIGLPHPQRSLTYHQK